VTMNPTTSKTTNPHLRVTALVLLAIALLFTTPNAVAGEAQFSASGSWGPNAPVTDWSAPGGTWAFSFVLPNPTTVFDGGMNDLVTTSIASYSYSFNGSPVNIPAADVIFFPLADAGGFEIDFIAGGSDTTNGFACSPSMPCSFDVFGDQFYTGGLPLITLQPAAATAVDFNYTASIPAAPVRSAVSPSVPCPNRLRSPCWLSARWEPSRDEGSRSTEFPARSVTVSVRDACYLSGCHARRGRSGFLTSSPVCGCLSVVFVAFAAASLRTSPCSPPRARPSRTR